MRSEKQTVLDILGQPRNGDHFDRKQTDKEMIELINTKNEQLAILHQVNSRLGYELSLLQKKMGIDPHIVLKELEKIGEVSVAFHADLGQLQCLDHLFLAYDETILKQKKIIAMLYSQLEDAERKAESLISEKQYLLEENKNKCKKILEIYHRGYPEENLTSSYIKLLREMQNQKALLVREESEHILDAYRELQNKSIDVQQELQEQRTNASTYFQSFKRQSEELKEALMSVDNLLKVKDFLEKTVNKLGEQNINLQNTKTQVQGRVGKLESEVKSLRTQLFNQKKLNRQQSQRGSIEMDSMKSQTQNATKRERQTFNKMMIIQKELQTAKDSLRSLKRQNQKIKSDFQQTIKMCEAYQSKITSLTRREENVRNIVDQSKQKLEIILLERDKAMLKVQQLQKILENMSERHRQQLTKQRENYQKMLFELQQKLRMLTDEKQQSESIFMESELGYKNQLQKLRRQNSLLHEENIKFIQNIHVNTGSQIISKLKQYQSKNDTLMKLLNQKERALKDQQSKHEEAVHEYDSQIRNINRLLDKQKSLTTQYMKELTQERSKVNITSNEKECLENQIRKLKKNQDYKSGQMNDQRDYRVHQLEGKLADAVKKEKETRLRAIQMLEKYDEAEEKLKSQYQKRIVEVQTQNEKLKRKLAKLKQ